jgi:Domain of unknown function (DUF5047)
MYPVTAKYLETLRDSRAAYCYADLYYYGDKINRSPIPVVDGSVTVDRTQNIRRTITATLGDPTLFQKYVQSNLAPFGAEIYIYQGINYMDGTTEVVPLGIFSMETVTYEESVTQSAGGLLQFTGNDRSQVLERDQFLVPVDYSGYVTSAAIQQLVQTALPQVTVNFCEALLNPVLPGGTTFSGTRLDAIQTLAAGIGAEAYFDVLGVFQVVPVEVLTQANLAGNLQNPAWTVDASTTEAVANGASEKGVLVQAARGISRTDAYNGVAVYGTGTTSSAQPVGFAFDTDPQSPTYWGGTLLNSPPGAYGRVTASIQIQTATTDAQCAVAAQAALSDALGLAWTVQFTCSPNPALEAGDFLKFIYPGGSYELHLLDSFQVPLNLTTGSWTGTTRTIYQRSGR